MDIERGRIGYHGRVSALARWQMKSAREAQETQADKQRKENPIFWIRLENVTEEIFGQVVGIYDSVFNKNKAELVMPDFEGFAEKIVNEGYLDWDLLGQNKTPLEVRRRIGANGIIFIRFRTMPGGSTKIEEAPNPKREEFQNKVDTLLIEKGLAVRLEDTYKLEF